MQLNGILAVVGLVLTVVLALPLLIGAVFVVVVVANRADPDATGRRPGSVYAFATSFVTLFASLFATTGIVASLAQLIGKHRNAMSSGLLHLNAAAADGSRHPIGDAVARGAVLSGIVALVAGAVFLHHIRVAAAASDGVDAADPVARVRSSYVAAVAFLSVAIAVVATVVVGYDIFRVIAPGVFSGVGDGNRPVVFRSLLPALWLGIASLVILREHLGHAPAPFRPAGVGRSRLFGRPGAPQSSDVPE